MNKPDRTWTISELAREFKVTPRALRFYEDKGLLSPRREGANRVYGPRERARISLILRGKRVGFPLAEIREILDLYDLGDGQRAQMAAAQKKFRARIVALERQKHDIAEAIAALEEGVAWIERQLAQPGPASGVAAARAFEQEARKRLEDAP